MASISKIVTPDGETAYDIKDLYRGCEFIYGTQTAKTGTWTGVSKDSELVDGKQILYFLPFAGSGNATLNLTLADGTTTGAKNVYFHSTTRMTTHYGQYSQFRMIYHKAHKIGNTTYEGWWSEPGRDTTTTNATQMQLNNNALVAGASALVAGNIIVANSSGKYVHLKSNTPFDITYPIVYLSTACAANTATNNVYSEINFTVTTTQSITLTAQEPVFVKGTLSGKMFTPISTTPLTQTIPTSADGYHYLYLGYGYAATAIRLQPYHPVFAYRDGGFSLIAASDHLVNFMPVETANDTPILLSPHGIGVENPEAAAVIMNDNFRYNVTSETLTVNNISTLTVNGVKIENIYKTYKEFSQYTTSTSWKYSGNSLVIPSGYLAILYIWARHLNSTPAGILLSKSSTSMASQNVVALSDGGSALHVNLPSGTYYIWTKYNEAAKNRTDVTGLVYKITQLDMIDIFP